MDCPDPGGRMDRDVPKFREFTLLNGLKVYLLVIGVVIAIILATVLLALGFDVIRIRTYGILLGFGSLIFISFLVLFPLQLAKKIWHQCRKCGYGFQTTGILVYSIQGVGKNSYDVPNVDNGT